MLGNLRMNSLKIPAAILADELPRKQICAIVEKNVAEVLEQFLNDEFPKNLVDKCLT